MAVRRTTLMFALTMLGLLLGLLLHANGESRAAHGFWISTTGLALVAATAAVARRLLQGDVGVDVIAVLAMGGSLLLREELAGAVIAVMLTGGVALEDYAVTRARRALSALLARAPRVAHRRSGDQVIDVEVDAVAVGDELLVKPGEVVPVDGVVVSDGVVLDEAALTGESRPVERRRGDRLQSGATNAGPPFELRVTALAAESTYAGIIRLVAAAVEAKPRFVRLAERYSFAFLILTVVLAAGTWWLFGATRALAVLVVATPCPLLLAAPAAIVAGVSRAARHGVIVKGGGALETLAEAEILLLDKTGTVTAARPSVTAVEALGALPERELVRLAASLEQVSLHPFAPALTSYARARGEALSLPFGAREESGVGIHGRVDGCHVAVGQRAFVAPGAAATSRVRSIERRSQIEGTSNVWVAVDDKLAGVFVLHDPVRVEAPRIIQRLRAAGFRAVHMVTGDHPDTAELVGASVGVDRVFAERAPAEKVDVVRLVRGGGITVMVGDGINDAPALAAADVGVAMGASGATAASEAADVVLVSGRFDALLAARRIAQRTRRIARQSVVGGMGLSVVAMGFAAAGLITPVAGAILQEAIDLLVILNALRALGGRDVTDLPRPRERALGQELARAHQGLRPQVAALATLAARLDDLPPADALAGLRDAQTMLEGQLLPHEREEQRSAYPVLAARMGNEDPTPVLVQTHHEIERLVRLFGRLVAQIGPGGPARDEVRDCVRALCGLHAVLSLHFAQEEELYSLFEG